jgi:diguanylate cyclase (GGDEF)-like protein/PAS domain S-box-containing protein
MANDTDPKFGRSAETGSAPEAFAIRVLQLEDVPTDAELVRRRLVADGLDVVCRVVADEAGFRHALVEFAPQIVLSDFSLRGFDGLAALEIARELAPRTPFVFVSGTIGEERAIEALKRGATDYVLKDSLRRLVPAIRSALRQAQVAIAKETAEDMLRRSESRLQDIVNTSRDWIWECDRDGRFTFSSPSVLDVLGYTLYEVVGRSATEFIDPADELQLQATYAGSADHDLDRPVTLRWRHKNGQPRWLERTMVALRDSEGEWRGVRGIDRDVTMRVAQDVRIRRLNRALRFLSGTSSTGMRIRDRDRLVKEACHLAVNTGGYARATIYLTPSDLAGTEPLVCSHAGVQSDGTKWVVTNRLPGGVNLVTHVLATAEPIVVNDLTDPGEAGLLGRDSQVPAGSRSRIALPLLADRKTIGVLELDGSEPGVFSDAEVALLKQVAANVTFALQYLYSKQSAEYLEYYDPATGLPNRGLHARRVAAALESAALAKRDLAVAVTDVVELGMVNDSLGYHAGDLLLQQIAERLRNEFREPDYIGRLSGDRLSIAAVAEGSGARLPERIADCFHAPFSLDGHEIHVAVRVGMAAFPEDGADVETLLQQANMALQHAKETGVSAVRYRASMNATASQRFNLTNELRRAAAEHEFHLHYQPKINLKSGLVDGVESLLRWSSGSEPVSPGVFVPLLESLGLIDEVGSWVIVRALTETAAWTVNEGFRVAANVSPLQLNRDDFADRVLGSIADLGSDPKRLELEVTESSLMADPRRASLGLARLRAAGVAIAIYDFGTGHSSLRMLAGLPIDVLKIDGSFVRDLVTNRNHRLIVQTTIGLAASLGLRTVAEGVETAEQLALLKDLGCDSVQGYLISRPVDAASVATWFNGDTLARLRQLVDGHPMSTSRTASRRVR